MDLDRHLAVLWERRFIVLGGVVLGLVVAFLAAYQPGPGGFERRGGEEWSSSSMVLVTQEGFPWGRVTLPGQTVPGEVPDAVPAPDATGEKKDLTFADPTRFSGLALVYSVMSYSDRVRQTLPGRPSAEQITAAPFDPTGRGDQLLPIVQITTTAGSAAAAHELNRKTVAGLRQAIVQAQRRNAIPEKDRVRLQLLKAADPPVLLAGRSWTSSILGFLLCLGAAVALAHLLEGFSMGRERKPEAAPLDAFGLDSIELTAKPDLWNRDSEGVPTRLGAYRDRVRDG
jgi:hypothetical protein